MRETSGHHIDFILSEMSYARGLQCQTQYYRTNGVEYERPGTKEKPLTL